MTKDDSVTASLPRRTGGGRAAILAAGLLLILQACAARQEAPPPQAEPAPPPAAPTVAAPEVRSFEGRFFADAHEYPWSALGRVNRAGLGFCNGILIGPRQVLTQAQCLYARREGRWWQPGELHFLAAYQKDSYLADSRIAGFTAAPGYNPAAGATLVNLTNNWAVLELRDPIGLKTGWLGLQWNDAAVGAQEAGGSAVVLPAGYRTDWPHAISLYFGCEEASGGPADLCQATPSERALPPFVLSEGELRIVADHYLRTAAQGSALARLAALPRRGDRLGQAVPPSANSPVRRIPNVSAANLLQGLGYAADVGLGQAANRFRNDRGLAGHGPVDIALLTALLQAARSGTTR